MDKIEFSYKRKYRPGSGGNGLILGQPGSGKTYLAQKEIIDVLNRIVYMKHQMNSFYTLDLRCHLVYIYMVQ